MRSQQRVRRGSPALGDQSCPAAMRAQGFIRSPFGSSPAVRPEAVSSRVRSSVLASGAHRPTALSGHGRVPAGHPTASLWQGYSHPAGPLLPCSSCAPRASRWSFDLRGPGCRRRLLRWRRTGPRRGESSRLTFPWWRFWRSLGALFSSKRAARGRVDGLVPVVPADAIARRRVAPQDFLDHTRARPPVR